MLATALSTATLVAGMLGMPIASADTGGPAEAATTAPATATPATLTVAESLTLTADHAGSIVITADDVVLDCAGHTVSGPTTRASSGGIEFVNVSGVTIRNCVVTGFEVNGIYGFGSTGVRLQRNTLVANGNHGIHLHAATDTVIARNTVRDNGIDKPTIGIVLTESASTIIRSNVVTGHQWCGIALFDGTAGSTIARNTVTGNYSGILVQDESNDNVVRANTASRNTHGISILAARRNVVDGNTANSNEYVAFSADWGSASNTFSGNTANRNNDGFALHGANSNVVTGNTANRNRHAGFLAWDGAGDNTLSGNTATGNAWFDAYDEGTGAGNTWYGNTFRTTSGL
jgi:parallel beta-helix repeat protein